MKTLVIEGGVKRRMDYKSVLQGQIRELEKLQDENAISKDQLWIRVVNATKIADQICRIYVEVKGPMD